MKYSVIIPVYNRPDEARELLESLCAQTCRDFEVVIVEDGSAIPCKEVAEAYADRLDIHYYVKENGGPGRARNYGVERARGEYVLILDSDAVLPEGYIAAGQTFGVDCAAGFYVVRLTAADGVAAAVKAIVK